MSASQKYKGPPPQYLPWILAVALPWTREECLLWPFYRRPDGYPGIVRHEGRSNGAHNVICTLAHGPAPSDKPHATHSCGRGHEGCVSPKHLRWGSALDNHLEKWAHGTGQFGEAHGRAKVTEKDVLAIRASKSSQRKIAEKYGLTQSTVWAIIHRRIWSHI